MIATDNHLGYLSKDPLRRSDSFAAFEEVLSKTSELQCDFLLLGGDLFHDHSPDKAVLNSTMEMFARHVVGQSNVDFEVKQGPELNFMNPSLAVKLPVFIIHGNHDDPSADTHVSALNLLHSANFLNYLTCNVEEDQVVVRPVQIFKRGTCVYIYGLGHIKEERLNRLIKTNRVIFEKPEDVKSGVFILVVHQNRFKACGPSAKNCVQDWVFPSFFDLIIWGHEHDCETEARRTQNRNYQIFQPGSTVSTSLTEGEARAKHMFLLEIRKLGFKMTPIPIRATRQILFKHIELANLKSENIVQEVCDIFDSLLKESDPNRTLKPPLVRLKIEVTGFEDFCGFALNSKFSESTANKDVVALWKRSKPKNDEESKESLFIKENSLNKSQEFLKIMKKSLSGAKDKFRVIGVDQILSKIGDFVNKKDTNGIEEYFERKVEMAADGYGEGIKFFDLEVIKKRCKEVDVSLIDPPIKRKLEVGNRKC